MCTQTQKQLVGAATCCVANALNGAPAQCRPVAQCSAVDRWTPQPWVFSLHHRFPVVTCAAVLAAFALWANANIADVRLADDARGRIAAVCSCIRFPEVPPDVLINYWACFSWLQQYDRNRDLLLRAVSALEARRFDSMELKSDLQLVYPG